MIKDRLIRKLYYRFNKLINRPVIEDALQIICQYMTNELAKDRSVTIENFGTLSSYVFPEHLCGNFGGELALAPEQRRVCLRPSRVLREAVSRRKYDLKKIVDRLTSDRSKT